LYHNLTRHFFGLGDYIPHVSVFKHPTTGWMYSAMDGIKGASHREHNGFNQEQNDTLYNLYKSGDLHKLMLMNGILTNSDRHGNNYMFGEDNSKFFLIDHGYALHGHGGVYNFPHYAAEAHNIAKSREKHVRTGHIPLHPVAAQWALSFDPAKMREFMEKHNANENAIETAVDRLGHLQKFLRNTPDARAEEAWGAMDQYQGYHNGRFAAGEQWRAENGPSAKKRQKAGEQDLKIQALGIDRHRDGPGMTLDREDKQGLQALAALFDIPHDSNEPEGALRAKIHEAIGDKVRAHADKRAQRSRDEREKRGKNVAEEMKRQGGLVEAVNRDEGKDLKHIGGGRSDWGSHDLKAVGEVLGIPYNGNRDEFVRDLSQKFHDTFNRRADIRMKDKEINRELEREHVKGLAADLERQNRAARRRGREEPNSRIIPMGPGMASERAKAFGVKEEGLGDYDSAGDAARKRAAEKIHQIIAASVKRRADKADQESFDRRRADHDAKEAGEMEEGRRRHEELAAEVKRQKPDVQQVIDAKEGLKPGAPVLNKKKVRRITLPGQQSFGKKEQE
jgi:hypothetical protein